VYCRAATVVLAAKVTVGLTAVALAKARSTVLQLEANSEGHSHLTLKQNKYGTHQIKSQTQMCRKTRYVSLRKYVVRKSWRRSFSCFAKPSARGECPQGEGAVVASRGRTYGRAIAVSCCPYSVRTTYSTSSVSHPGISPNECAAYFS